MMRTRRKCARRRGKLSGWELGETRSEVLARGQVVANGAENRATKFSETLDDATEARYYQRLSLMRRQKLVTLFDN